jgi:hypothetical protein
MIPPIWSLAFLALFLRKELLIFALAFLAGGILTLKYPVVSVYMKKAETIIDNVILPDLERTKDQVEDILNEKVNGV